MKETASGIWQFVDSTLLSVFKPGALQDSDLAELFADLKTRPGLRGVVIVPADRVPSPAQRTAIKDWFSSSNARISVITDSLVARGAVTALRWFNLEVSAFDPSALDAAFEFAGLKPAHRGEATAALRSMAENTGNPIHRAFHP